MSTSNMTIKPINKSDIEVYTKVFVQAYNQPPWNYHWKFEDAVKYLNEYIASPHFKGFSLYDNNVFIGAIFAHTKTWWTGEQLYIDEFFIEPDLQKKGYGKFLEKHTEQYALEHGLGTITLMTHKFMPAMKFYTGINFMHAQPFVILFKQMTDGM
ncbi:acetyltransferase (GNAT) family protein [Chitinophaga niastensis]|uniref:Acetyltransferase (GNAT) family protein n=1 Tax=Chitinophaga niastensis TaxID=536980 RepID=A0A2P8HP98_CHINA|nr:GNAT family N-acetyltransferase [Chitinophaga niastensis]PSL48038.1 acetyltransferase (GNAT) family protein [Chitinophaga niastensis]